MHQKMIVMNQKKKGPAIPSLPGRAFNYILNLQFLVLIVARNSIFAGTHFFPCFVDNARDAVDL